MSDTFRLTLAQFNPVLGDLAGNRARALAAHAAGHEAGAALVALPEMFLTGYQPRDLVRRPAFLRDVARHLDELAAECAEGPALGIGAPWQEGDAVYNAWHVLSGGRVVARLFKHHLPDYEVFDEPRVFASGAIPGPFALGGLRIGTPICEDAWFEDVAEAHAESGAEILLVPNGSPWHRGKRDTRMSLMVARVVETGLPLVYLNMVGGQDDQVFDGASFVLDRGGHLAAQLPAFEEAVAHVDFRRENGLWHPLPAAEPSPLPDEWEADYHAMVLGLRDYLAKTGFSRVLLGLSGGVDSALVATIAADALGPEAVRAVLMPSRHTGPESIEDARALAGLLGLQLDEIGIEGPRGAVEEALAPLFEGRAPDLTEENIQSRLRGLLLMALSNKFGEMLLTTGNKSEVAVGYATIYGDMAGGYNPIKDLYKTRVFETCRWRNANHRPWMRGPEGRVIPERIIDKPPSAELRDDQRDDDSLPPYEVLDPILEGLVDREDSVAALVASGFDEATVRRVERLIFLSEYKRQQAAPGVRLTPRSFGLDRRYPIVNRWRDGG